jgi:hypothetical protein
MKPPRQSPAAASEPTPVAGAELAEVNGARFIKRAAVAGAVGVTGALYVDEKREQQGSYSGYSGPF